MKRSPERRIVEALHDLYTPVGLDAFPTTVMRVLRSIIQTDIASYTEVNHAKNRAVGALDVPDFDMDDVSRRFGPLIHQHPIIQHFANTGDGSARRITDFISQQAFEDLELFWDIYRPMGVRKQMAITVASTEGTVIGAIVNRGKKEFGNADRDALNLIGRHLTIAYHNAELLTRLEDERAALAAATESAGLGVVVVDGAGNIITLSERGQSLFKLVNGVPFDKKILPGVIRQWFIDLLARPLATASAVSRLSVTCQGGTSVLMVRWAGSPRPGRHTLVLEADPSAIAPSAILSAGLTQREGEVLQWIAQGKTNNDIAAILGSSPRTVQKHVERLLKKLNVETRVAAVARAREL